MVDDLVSDLQPSFRPQDYNLLFNNCNHFSHQLAQLLVGEGIPVSKGFAAVMCLARDWAGG